MSHLLEWNPLAGSGVVVLILLAGEWARASYRCRLAFSWRICLAFSSSLFRWGGRFLPARLMKNWIMRIPEPMPLGLTFLLAIVRAMVWASLVNRPCGG